VDLLGDVVEVFGGVTNGHGRSVTFDDGAQGLPDPAYVSQSGNSNKELLQRHMSEGEILGYQNEYGESVTHQLEYGLDSDDDDDDNNLVDFGDSQNGPVSYPGPPVDQDYLMSTGQPLLDFSNDLQSVPPLSEQQDLLGGDNFEDCSSQNFEQYQNQVAMDDTEYFDNDVANNAQEQVENDHKTDDIDPNNWQPEMEAEERGVDQSEPLEDNWQPERDSERARRSVSPDRSLSPLRAYSQSEGAEGVTSPQCETESYENVDSEDISSLSESHPEPTHILQQPLIPHSDAEHSDRSQADQWESDSVTSDASGAPKFRSGVPRLRKIKKAKDLPPWNDNVVLPKQPRVRPTFIGNKEYLPTAGSSPDRPKTAPAHFIAKDASSDSGVEDDKNNGPNKESDEARRKYGTDTKNDRYKPGGGQVQIFSQKVDTKHISGRTDCKIPKSALTPRSPVKSPTPVRAATPNTKQVQSKIGSLNNVKHSPGGGNVHILSAKPDFSNVKSKVGSKDKLDHKPKGGDKKIESRKLEWKTSSKVGSLKNVEYSPGGGQVKILDQKVEVKAQSKVGSTANLKHKPGGGDKKIETQKLEFTEKAKSKVGSMDKIQHKPGGGDIKILDEKIEIVAKPKVGSLDKVKHQPGGGDKKIETQKLSFKETAKPRTNTGGSSGRPRSRDSHSCSDSVTSSQDGSLVQE